MTWQFVDHHKNSQTAFDDNYDMAQGSTKPSGAKDAKTKSHDKGESATSSTTASTMGNGRQVPGATSSSSASSGPGPRITLTGAQQTNLSTLCARAQDAKSARPLLNDRWALHVLEQVPGYDFAGVAPGALAGAAVVNRALTLDRWAASFLERNPRATVIHLACGLDSRCLRLRWGGDGADKAGMAAKGAFSDVCWVDLDLPDVVALRRQLLPLALGAGGRLPPHRGLDGVALLRRLLKRFPSGSLVFDCVGSLVLRAQGLIGVLRHTGATFAWAVDHPRYLELLDERLRLVETAELLDLMARVVVEGEALPAPVRWALRGLGYVPCLGAVAEHVVRDIIAPMNIVRFEF
ncbi:tetracenomycin polyketide synthesis O-methyltransferase TcmP [Apiospora aurea]|uniref:Tetracenomycin polyketide synthesis O-methyltransferase TcmP n=1 Tax=Apiospora aurea TaxID=335848 RepID=A0ABR1PT76_9PEZI